MTDMKTQIGNTLKVAYNPNLSQETQKDIIDNISFSMASNDETTCQYNLDTCIEWFKNFYDLDQIEGEILNDYNILMYLVEENFDYIEI